MNEASTKACTAIDFMTGPGELVCPRCGGEIRERFYRFAPPFMYMHRSPRWGPCRLVLVLDPSGEDHTIRVVPFERSMESVALAETTPDDMMRRARALADYFAFAYQQQQPQGEG